LASVEQTKPTPVRMPDDLRIWLKHQSVDNRRSLNAEIVDRLEQSRRRQLEKEAARVKAKEKAK
jgi:hypothetical protein